MIFLCITLAGGILFFACAQMFGTRFAAVAMVVMTTCTFPIALVGKSAQLNVGIAAASPQVRTFSVLLAGIFLASLLSRGIRDMHLSHIFFLAWLGYASAEYWNRSPLLAAGVLQLGIGLAAWCSGNFVARLRKRPNYERALVLLFGGLVLLECVVCILQFIGVPINPLDAADAAILGNRVNGTANHPDNLGKLMIISLIFLLPLTESLDRAVGRRAIQACFLMFVPLGLAQGRANMLAIILALVLWAVLSPDSRFTGRRAAIIAATIAGVGASATALAARFQEDPEGGVRSQILAIAYQNIPQHLWHGVGPNLYVQEIASKFGSYIPVHNSFVLLVAETGLIGALLFAFPVIGVGLRALLGFRRSRYLRAILVTAPGLAAIGWTGWGLLGTSVLPFLMFALAYSARLGAAEGSGEEHPEERGNTEEGHRRNSDQVQLVDALSR